MVEQIAFFASRLVAACSSRNMPLASTLCVAFGQKSSVVDTATASGVEPLVDRRRTHASVHGSRVRCILQHAKRVRLVRCSKRLSDGRRLQPDNRHHRLDHVDWSMSVVIGCRICICLLLSPSTNDNSARESGPATSLSLMCIRHQKRTFRCPHRLSYSQQLHIANRGHARVVTWARVDVCCATTFLDPTLSFLEEEGVTSVIVVQVVSGNLWVVDLLRSRLIQGDATIGALGIVAIRDPSQLGEQLTTIESVGLTISTLITTSMSPVSCKLVHIAVIASIFVNC
jgi:hypothetical protein